jgi:hypothetical protein
MLFKQRGKVTLYPLPRNVGWYIKNKMIDFDVHGGVWQEAVLSAGAIGSFNSAYVDSKFNDMLAVPVKPICRSDI